MSNDDVWKDVTKDIKKIKVNRFVEEIKPKELIIKKDKEVSVTFNDIKKGALVGKDDFSQIDGSLAKRFKREEIKIEAVLDLHGVVEKDAYNQVCSFIKNAYNNKKRCVLIVTGKGVRENDDIFNKRGVLRKSVPQWLSGDEIGYLILAYKNPSEALGGKGALYVLLRKKS